jgi:hypothetical protein
MPADHTPSEYPAITRTVKITTVETWSITIGLEDARADIVIDQIVQEARTSNGEEACSTNPF